MAFNPEDFADFREMYMRRLHALGHSREECNAAVRQVCYAFRQDPNWRDYASPVHPHNLAERHHFEQQLERLKARERH